VNRFPISAIRAIFILALCLGFSGPFAARPAQAATVFSNYTGSVCSCGFNFDFYAVGFAPASDFEFTGAAAFVQSQDSTSPETFSMALYSSNGAGAPGSSLWTSGPLIAPANTSTLVNASDAGPSISLQGGIVRGRDLVAHRRLAVRAIRNIRRCYQGVDPGTRDLDFAAGRLRADGLCLTQAEATAFGSTHDLCPGAPILSRGRAGST